MKSFHQKVYLIRHGETEWTKSKQHTGKTDLPLTQEGKNQVQWLRPRLKGISFKKVWCSPLQRAQQTCEAAGLKRQTRLEDDLVEWDYGDYEGLTTQQIHEIEPGWTIFTHGGPQGESVGDIASRTKRLIRKVREVPGDVALFSSGHFSRAFAAVWLGMSVADGRRFLLSTASVSVLGFERETPVIVSWNETQFSQGD